MKKLPLFISLLLLLTCAKEDSQAPNTPPSQISRQYTLSVSAGDGGSVSTAGGTFASGTQVSLTATPNVGYSFSSWSNGSTANPLTVTLNSNTTITANFQVIVNSYTLTVTAGEGGTVGGGGEYEEGTEVTITATPADGYEFTGWSDGEISISRVITISSDTTISASFQILPFISRSPSYNGINATDGFIRKNYFYPGINMNFNENNPKLDKIESLIYEENGIRYNPTLKSSAFIDFDNNGHLDFVGFMEAENWDDPCGNKLRVVKNIFTNESEYLIYDNSYLFGPMISVNDFNGDGIDDILAGSSNYHFCGQNGINGEMIPVEIYYFNADGTYQKESVSPPTQMHDIISGDLDNDGDIDIIYFTFRQEIDNPNQNDGYPYIYLNDGNGNFTEGSNSSNFLNFDSLVEQVYQRKFNNLSINLADLNNDDILDIVIGDNFLADFYLINDYNNDGEADRYHYGAKIIWGLGNAQYDFNNMTSLESNWIETNKNDVIGSTYESGSSSGVWTDEGFYSLHSSFFDYDYDGDLDIFITGASAYRGNFFMAFTNNGNSTFIDSTESLLDEHYFFHGTRGGWNMNSGQGDPQFYEIFIIDFNNDSLFDLVPGGSGWFSGLHYNPNKPEWYYKNTGNGFIKTNKW